jgi:hypothetical protein
MEELKTLAGKRRVELQFTYKMPRKILSEYAEKFLAARRWSHVPLLV